MLYEVFCLISSKIEEKNVPPVVEKIEGAIVNLKGVITQKENLGEKKLAYSIKKERTGYGLVVYFEAEPEVAKPLEEKLKTIPEVIRFQIVKAKKAKPEEKKEKIEEKTEKKEDLKLNVNQIFDKLDI